MSKNCTFGSSCRPSLCSLVTVPQHVLEKQLKCPVCQRISVPPIYTCNKGHTICSSCIVNVNLCPSCRNPFTSTRNLPLEAIAHSVRFYCQYRTNGCKTLLKFTKLHEHHRHCVFRPLKCHLSHHNGCKTVAPIYLCDYVDHLMSAHNVAFVLPEEGQPNVFRTKYSCDDWGNEFFTTNHCWASSLFNYHGQVFVTQVFNRGPALHFKLAIISKEATKTLHQTYKYYVKIKMNKHSSEKFATTVGIHSIPELETEEPQNDSSGTEISKTLLEQFGQVISETGLPFRTKFKWNVQYEIAWLNA